ncbi:MAG: S9 family peptidase [Saprospiraceae bacterium]|nr:S9 family peptidase [Saprospiraceae bacterium]
MIESDIHRSMFKKIILLLGCMYLFQSVSIAQTLKKMTPRVYNEWNTIKNVKMSDSANTIIYTLEKETGDKKLCVYYKVNHTTIAFNRVKSAEVDVSGRFVIFTHGLSDDSLRTLKRKKTAKDKLPSDSLSVFDVVTQQTQVIEKVSSFVLPIKYGGYCVYVKSKQKEAQDSTKKEKPKTPVCDVQTIIIRKLYTGKEDTIKNVKDFLLAEEVPLLVYSRCTGDSIAGYQVYYHDLETKESKLISKKLSQVKQLSWDKKGDKLAFLGLEEKSVLTKKPFSLFLYSTSDSLAQRIAGQESSFKTADWLISDDKKITFSESGKKLFFGTTPPVPEKDTMMLDDEIVNVEIWHHDTPWLYTQMESNLEEDKKKAYTAIFDLESNKLDQLESPEFDKSIVSLKGDGKYVLLIRTLPYRKSVTWLGDVKKDIFLYDLLNNTSTLIAEGQSDMPDFSPAGKYIYWYNRPDSLWKYYDIAKMKLGFLGDKSLTAFYDEENDIPQLPGDHGVAGWLKEDKAILIYDKYDIWKISPDDPMSNIAFTDGRLKKLRYKYIKLSSELEFIDPAVPMMLHVFNEKSKTESYATLDFKSGRINIMAEGEYAFSKVVTKAKKSPDIIFTKQNFDLFPDLLLSDTLMSRVLNISEANPQQKEYSWGSNKLLKWVDTKGAERNGMLFLPPDFDPNKKYPLIVNFYERSSDDFNQHRAPQAHRSSINYTYYTNIGYVIFNPDIIYTLGQPGEDCYLTVNSGVDALVRQGFIDSTLMALQGHSWGGYQIAYILTKTGRFKCAEAGAPVVNMVSAYGGIRWGTGMSRMFQYEKTQSRIGKTLWENPSMYHFNSPLYQLDKVTTPVLIMHNDEDAAVPWEQGIEYYMAMRRLGKPVWLLNYNGEPHWPVKWQNRLDFNIRLEQFFNHYLMEGPLPLWMKEGNTPMEKGILNKY